ncbi:zona pellucida sperm-binding protein 3 receptor-like isoform X2 [Heterodontus francisci]|uniref:zona pellucida sperm-binding protein 3 receptor-like isoform X2 n=1 Tax=Heterodontus francisci TaxID=7792 RepID=UPI00355C4DDF
MAERLILALMAICTVGVAWVTGDCSRPPQLENGSPTNEFTSETLFDVGTNVTYKCYLGYIFKEGTLYGSRSVTCREDSMWTPLQAICEPRNCGNPGEILNGYYEAPNTTFGSKVTFHCKTGYQMVGRSYRFCKADGWDGQVPTCEAIACDDLPPIRNGTAPLPPYGDHWEYGMVAKYSCNGGYSLIGAETLVCTETREWDNDPPTCKAVECHRPDLPANGQIEAGFGPTYRYRETISYVCNEGFEMVGKSIIECKEDSTFAPALPTCKLIGCHRPDLPANGRIVSGFGPTYRYRENISFICNEGFEMVGKSVIECKEDSTFAPAPPTCKPVECHRPDLPANGQIEAGFGPTYRYQETISYVCNEGFEMVGESVIECKENNIFVPAPPTCKFIGCHRPDLPANGQIVSGFGPTYRYRENISFICNEGFEMVGKSVIECKEDSTFAPAPPTCKPIECPCPDLPANGRIVSGFGPTYRYRENISFNCNEGFEMVGKSVIECKEDSTFAPAPPTCKPTNCSNPGEILNGYYEVPNTTFETKVTFHCNKGYRMVGRDYWLCKADGWDGQVPTCEVLKCDILSINNGIASSPPSGGHWEQGMGANCSCNRGYLLIGAERLVCTATGEWDKDLPTCKVVECHRPELPANGRIVAGFGPTYKYQENISFICNEGFEMVGKSVIECKDNNTFAPAPPTCKKTKMPLVRKVGETKQEPLLTNAQDKQGLGTTGITISCIIGICVGIGGVAGLSYYNKKRQCNTCKTVHINPEPNQSQVEANFIQYRDHPA